MTNNTVRRMIIVAITVKLALAFMSINTVSAFQSGREDMSISSQAESGPIGENGYGIVVISNSIIGPSSGAALWGGKLYIGEGFLPGFSNQPVVQLSPAGHGAVKSTYGTGLNLPDEIAFRTDGVLFVVDRYATTPGIYMIPPGGGSASLFLDLTEGVLTYPTGIVFGPDGYLYVEDASSDMTTGYVKKFDAYVHGPPIATLIDPFPGPGTHGSILEGLAFDSSGKMYLARQDISRVDVYDPITEEWSYFSSPLMDEGIGIAVGPGPNGLGEFVYLTNWHVVTRSTLNGETTIRIASGLLNGMGCAVDASGVVFVGDNFGNATYAIQLSSVGGVSVSADKSVLLAPYIASISTILVTTAATAIYVKRRKKQ